LAHSIPFAAGLRLAPARRHAGAKRGLAGQFFLRKYTIAVSICPNRTAFAGEISNNLTTSGTRGVEVIDAVEKKADSHASQ
jgi:hypothetical protein